MAKWRRLSGFLTADDGPTAVEYAIMLALIVVISIGAIHTTGKKANTTFTNVGKSLKTANKKAAGS